MGADIIPIESVAFRAVETRLRETAKQLKMAARELEAIALQPMRLTRTMFSVDKIREQAVVLAALARREYEKRRLREALVPTAQFCDPAWDILLDLFARDLLKEQTTTTSSSIAAHCPPTTALRYIGLLEEEGMLVREKSTTDGRIVYVSLSEAALQSIGSYFLNSIGPSED